MSGRRCTASWRRAEPIDEPDAHASPHSPAFCAAGDTALVVEFGDRVDAHLSALVLALAQQLEAAAIPGVVEVVPTFRSLMVHYDPLQLPHAELQQRHRAAAARAWRPPRAPAGAGASPPATTRASASTSPRSRSAPASASPRSSSATAPRLHHVYMMGFLPGLPYLGGLPAEFELPRRENPRMQGAARLRRRRHGHDRHLSAGKPRRLAHPGAHAGAAVGHARARRRRCSRPATR